jgi:endonuclease/exonuclease/phosphatase (EEP) superfamily protein YafD
MLAQKTPASGILRECVLRAGHFRQDLGTMNDENGNWQLVIGIALGIAVTALAGGYLGWLHPFGDSLAVGRGIAAAAILAIAVFASFAGLRMAAFVSTLLALLTGGQVLLAYAWPGLPGRYAVYQKNMLFRNAELPALEADIRAANAQIVTLQEVSEPNLAMLSALRDAYPYQHSCPGTRVGGTAILTNLTPVPDTAFCGPGLAAMQVIAGAEGQDRFWIVSVHLHWPWPYSQADHVELLLPILDRLQGPAILAGDFNMVRWANSVKRLSDIVDTRPAGPIFGSYIGLNPNLGLPIDHVFAPRGGRVIPRGAFGSDHLGLLAQVDI